jgi:hypothetical protein
MCSFTLNSRELTGTAVQGYSYSNAHVQRNLNDTNSKKVYFMRPIDVSNLTPIAGQTFLALYKVKFSCVFGDDFLSIGHWVRKQKSAFSIRVNLD